MSEETPLQPTSIIAVQNLKDTLNNDPATRLADIQEGVETPDSNWWTAVDATMLTRDVLRFPAPNTPLVGPQKFRTWRRKTSGGASETHPLLTMNLLEDGVFKRCLLSSVPITSTTGQLFEGEWDASEVTDQSVVECEVIVHPGQERAFTVSPAVNGKTTWDLNVDGPMVLSEPGSWTITPLSTFAGFVTLWGPGGSSGGCGTDAILSPAGAGTDTTFGNLLTAGAGAVSVGAIGNPSITPGGVGGTATGGDINTAGATGGTGTTGTTSVGGDGAAAPDGGAAAIATVASGNGVAVNGVAGNAPGGGAAGPARSSNATGARRSVGGGGSGGLVIKNYRHGDLTPGVGITLIVGDSGAAGVVDLATGGKGGAGQARIE